MDVIINIININNIIIPYCLHGTLYFYCFFLFLYFSYYEIPVEFRLDFLPNFSVLLRFLFTL